MFGLLQAILCVLQNLALSILAVIIMAVNAMIAALALLFGPLLALLPEIPPFGGLPASFSTALGWVAWIFPVGTALSFFGFALTAWVAWQLVAFVLRWTKLGSGEV